MKRYHLKYLGPIIFTSLSLYIAIVKFSGELSYYLALIICITGLFIWWSGIITIGNVFTALPSAKGLVVKGIYSKISHPIYVGSILVFIAYCLFLKSWQIIIITISLIIIQLYRMSKENKLLKEKFGSQYLEYKKSTWF